jgi:hypothetical protein
MQLLLVRLCKQLYRSYEREVYIFLYAHSLTLIVGTRACRNRPGKDDQRIRQVSEFSTNPGPSSFISLRRSGPVCGRNKLSVVAHEVEQVI